MLAQFDWLHLIAFITGGLVGLFLRGATGLAKESDMAAEVEYYKRLAERKKEE